MEITELSVCKKNKNRANLYVDGKFVFACYIDVAAEYGLRQGGVVTPELLEEIRQEDAGQYAFQTGLKYASARPRTRREIADKLRGAGLDGEAAETALEKLVELGYVDDEEYARIYAEELRTRYGGRMVYQKLLRKGVNEELAARASREGEGDAALLKEQLARLELRYREDLPQKRRQKTVRALMAKGFDYEDIRDAMDHAD